MCDLAEHIAPLELPAEGVYLLETGRLSFVGEDVSLLSSALRCSMPARGYMLIQKTAGRWSAKRTAADTLLEARVEASAAGMHSTGAVVLGEVARMGGDPLAPVYLVAAVSVFEPITKGDLLRQAIDSVDDVISSLSVLRPVEKASKKDPFSKVGFDAHAAALAKALEQSFGDLPRQAIIDVVNGTTIDFAAATEAQVVDFAHRMNAAMVKAVGVPQWASVENAFETHTRKVSKGAVTTVIDKYKLGVSSSLSLKDQQAIKRSAVANTTFVRKSYQGDICPRTSEQARGIIQSGMENGYGSRVIGAELKSKLGSYVTDQNRDYFNVVSDAAVGRAREYSALRKYSESGVSVVIISSVLDERTTESCRFLDGKILEVEHCLQKYDEMEKAKDPGEVKWRMPWFREKTIQEGKDAGKRGIFMMQEKGMRQVATVEKAGFGSWDRGSYKGMGMREMVEIGIGPPPYHGHCLLEGSRVYTQRGLVCVEDLRAGDSALTHQGRWRPIVNIGWRWYEGGMTEMSSALGTVVLTDDHPVLMADGSWVAAGGVDGTARGVDQEELCSLFARIRSDAKPQGGEVLLAGMQESGAGGRIEERREGEEGEEGLRGVRNRAFGHEEHERQREGVGAGGASNIGDRIQPQPWPAPLGGRAGAEAIGGDRAFGVARCVRGGVRVFSFDVEDDASFVAASGVILHNCRTTTVPDVSYTPSVVVQPRVTSPKPKVPAPAKKPEERKPTIPNKPTPEKPRKSVAPKPDVGVVGYDQKKLAGAMRSKKPSVAEQAVIRDQLRAFVRETDGLVSFDQTSKKADTSSYGVLPRISNISFNGMHTWDGKTAATADMHDAAGAFLAKAEKHGASTAARDKSINGFKMLVHETIHECSPISRSAYKHVNMLIEEVSTEASARQMMIKKFGSKWGDFTSYDDYLLHASLSVKKAWNESGMGNVLPFKKVYAALGDAGNALKRSTKPGVLRTPEELLSAYSKSLADVLEDAIVPGKTSTDGLKTKFSEKVAKELTRAAEELSQRHGKLKK